MDKATDTGVASKNRPVTVTLDGAPSRAPVARSLAETLGILYEFSLDDVADIKLAVDEVCTELAQAGGADTPVVVTIEVHDRVMTVSASASLPPGAGIRQSGFGWHVLRTLTNRLSVQEPETSDSTDARPWVLSFSKNAGDSA